MAGSIKSELLDMEFDVCKTGNAFGSKADWHRNKEHSVGYRKCYQMLRKT